MVVKLDCKKYNVIVRCARVNSRTSGITISPEGKQAIFFSKLLAKLHEVTLK